MAERTLKPLGSVDFTIIGLDDGDNEAPIENAVVTADPRLKISMNPDNLSGKITSAGPAAVDMNVHGDADPQIGPGEGKVSGDTTITVSAGLATKLRFVLGEPS